MCCAAGFRGVDFSFKTSGKAQTEEPSIAMFGSGWLAFLTSLFSTSAEEHVSMVI